MELLAPIFLMPMVSYAYFLTSPETEPLKERLLVSAHGAVAALILIVAIVIGFSGEHSRSFGLPYKLAFSLPTASIIYSFFRFRGNKAIHLLQLINVPALLISLLMGSMAITGTWI